MSVPTPLDTSEAQRILGNLPYSLVERGGAADCILQIPREAHKSLSFSPRPWGGSRSDVDSNRQGPCVMASTNKFTQATEVLWRKTDGIATRERGPQPLPRQAFIAFLGTLHRGWSSFIMHRFTLSGYFLQITKERMLLSTTKKRMWQMQGEKWLNWLHSIINTDFRKLL